MASRAVRKQTPPKKATRTQVSLDRPGGVPIHAFAVLPELLHCSYTYTGLKSSRQLKGFQNRVDELTARLH